MPDSYCAIKFELKLNSGFDEFTNYLIFKADNDDVDWIFTFGSEHWQDVHYLRQDENNDSIDTYTPDDISAQVMVANNVYNTSPSDSIIYYFSIPHPSGLMEIMDTFNTDVKLREFHVVQNIKVDKLFNREFYVKVNGRHHSSYE
jgi:hypothetical protein